MSQVYIIGGGISGISAACYLAQAGRKVTIVEKNIDLGGRARQWESSGFKFDMGPSWYWMPDIFAEFFSDFGLKVEDQYELKRLDPSYRVFFSNKEWWDIPAGAQRVGDLFESYEPGAKKKLEDLLSKAEVKYRVGMQDYARRPSLTPLEFIDRRLLKESFRLGLLNSFGKSIRRRFRDKRIQQILEFPVLFLGATARATPAMYSLMNYADISLGTWYPMGGFHQLVAALTRLAQKIGVNIETDTPVQGLITNSDNLISEIRLEREARKIAPQRDLIIGAADYHHVENHLLPSDMRSYSARYWDTRVMAPSCLLYYLGIDRPVENLQHHNLFFDEDFDRHSKEIYISQQWPEAPLFYVCAPSKTDPSVAPNKCENLFILVPVAAGLKDTPALRERYFSFVETKLEQVTGIKISAHLSVRRDYAYSDFVSDYNSFKGNAYGLANTLSQTAFLRPSMRSKKVKNLFYCGQLTVPGPGVPPSILSGRTVSQLIDGLFPLKSH